ncbi:MAG: amidohydrolase family protein [Bacteroidota bacterium]
MKSQRFITCHSYQQGEILMLMKVAQQFGFRVNTFTHVLEGYKIADKLAAAGATGSTFSDWWAYKYEVIDAVPYNSALMAAKGVNVCVNSDDAEMGRRLNQEAAKGVKYGGMSEEEALKMVTLNPAKALRIDEWVGSLDRGKEADVVVWSDHPLSIYAHAEKTYVDGKLVFDVGLDQAARTWIQAERRRLVTKMSKAKDKGKGKVPGAPAPKNFHCDTLDDDRHE